MTPEADDGKGVRPSAQVAVDIDMRSTSERPGAARRADPEVAAVPRQGHTQATGEPA